MIFLKEPKSKKKKFGEGGGGGREVEAGLV